MSDEEQEQLRLRVRVAKAKAAAGGGRVGQLADIIRANKKPAADALTSSNFDNLTDGAGMVRSALSGVTSGVAPHILAGMEGVRGALTPGESYAGEHDKALPAYQEQYGKAVENHPLANIAGAVAQPNPLAKLKAASTLGKVGLAAARVGYSGANGKLAQYMGQTGPEAQDSGAIDGAKLPMAIQVGAEMASPALGKFIANNKRNTFRNTGFKF